MFFMISLFSIPIYMIYYCNSVNTLHGTLNKLSLGNLGGSDLVFSNHLVSKNLSLECSHGLIMMNDSNYLNDDLLFYDYGLISK